MEAATLRKLVEQKATWSETNTYRSPIGIYIRRQKDVDKKIDKERERFSRSDENRKI